MLSPLLLYSHVRGVPGTHFPKTLNTKVASNYETIFIIPEPSVESHNPLRTAGPTGFLCSGQKKYDQTYSFKEPPVLLLSG